MADKKTQIVITAKDETGAAIASAKRGLDSLSQAGSRLGSTFSSIGVGGGLIGLLGGAGLAASIKSTIDGLDQLNDSVERLGISAEDLSALNFAGKLNGIEAEDMTMALTKLSVKMQEAASGSKEAGALFADLGIKVTDSSGKLKGADQVFAEVADSFSKLEDGAGKTALAVDTFGKTGAKIVPVLNNGADGLARMRKEGEALGAIIDGKLAKQAAEFNDNLDKLSVVSAAAGRSITSELLPALVTLTEDFLIGITAAGGFWAALNAGATINPFKNTAENLATVRADLAKIEADQKEYGYLDEARYNRKIAQLKILEAQDARSKKALAGGLGINDIDDLANPKKAVVRTAVDADKPKKTGSASAQADEAARLLATLNEQIAVKEADAATTDKQTEAEKQAVKIRFQLKAETLKATEAQRAEIDAKLDSLVALDKTLAAQNEFNAALEKQEETNVKARQAMIEQAEAAELAAEMFGLNAAQISVVEQARLADAIAIAKENGASEEQIALMEEEMALRARLSGSLIKVEEKSQQKQDAEDAIKSLDEMGEFAKQAARNMQDAMAEFFIDPTKGGIQSLAETFGQTVQKMIAQAGAAQLGKLLFGDMDKTGNVGGLVGSIPWGEIFSSFAFENGGIMTSAGAMPLKKYATGGIANSPQLAYFGEGSTPEAYVPLPDGRHIPVQMSGSGGMTITQNIVVGANADRADVKRAAASGARSVLGLQNGARRYG